MYVFSLKKKKYLTERTWKFVHFLKMSTHNAQIMVSQFYFPLKGKKGSF